MIKSFIFKLTKITHVFQDIKGKATVPGNIYQDLVNNNLIDQTSEYADVNNTWVARESWLYTKKFNGINLFSYFFVSL